MPRIEYGGQVHDFPDDFTDDDIRTAGRGRPEVAVEDVAFIAPETPES